MLAIVTPEQMRAIDHAAAEPVEELVERAGGAVARSALRMLGGAYGRVVVVIAGPGNNGADGRVAGRRLAERGVRVTVIEADACPTTLPPCDLVIDAAYGTGFHGNWDGPDPGGAPVLAVDIPSGVDGLTGKAGDGVIPADRTVTFAALKPGLLFPPGADFCGEIEVVDIGLDTSSASVHLVQHSDVARWVLPRTTDAHKWGAALWVIAGSTGMLGSAHLASAAAQRCGAGMVRLSTPGVANDPLTPTEVVAKALSAQGWAGEVLSDTDRFHAMVIGPGLGRSDAATLAVRDVVARCPLPIVVDGDGLFALAWSGEGARMVLQARTAPTVLTPHDGEFSLLRGARVGARRIDAARQLAADTGAVVLLKGAATTIAEPGGRVLVSTSGDERLATAGTGDVLAGIIGALLARGLPAFEAAAAGAWIHGEAGRLGPTQGLVASDLPPLVPAVLESLE